MMNHDSETVYEPEDDSLLMQEQVKKYAYGAVLDMGCGSGILGIEALKKRDVKYVVFADINSKALVHAKTEVSKNTEQGLVSREKARRCRYIRTDLFSNIIKESSDSIFDTIIFNPPYLPEDKYDNEKLITTGGKKGHELLVRFLKQSKKHLNDQGIMLILFSSLTGKSSIDNIIKSLGYEKHTIVKKALFMEILYTYKINKISKILTLKGRRGIVNVSEMSIGKRRIKVAIKRSLSPNYNYKKEAEMLSLLNKRKIGPMLLRIDDKKECIVMEYVDGKRILEFLDTGAGKATVISIIKSILNQLYTMDMLGINKTELTNPYKHIIINSKHEPVMIDFERCHHTNKPKNLTQFIQFLCSGKFKLSLKKNSLDIDVAALRMIAEDYKKHIIILKKTDDSIIDRIICCIQQVK